MSSYFEGVAVVMYLRETAAVNAPFDDRIVSTTTDSHYEGVDYNACIQMQCESDLLLKRCGPAPDGLPLTTSARAGPRISTALAGAMLTATLFQIGPGKGQMRVVRGAEWVRK